MSERSTEEITRLLRAWEADRPAVLEKLLPEVYQELHRLAHHYMAGERAGHLLQTTALIHEAYLRLADIRQVYWNSRTHFYAVAATMMRRVLVDLARTRSADKRGGGRQQVELQESALLSPEKSLSVVALDDALNSLSSIDPRKARVVELRFFGGLTEEETAETLALSVDTVKRDWNFAKAWIYHQMKPGSSE